MVCNLVIRAQRYWHTFKLSQRVIQNVWRLETRICICICTSQILLTKNDQILLKHSVTNNTYMWLTTGRYCTCCLLFHISKIQLQIGFAHINQVSSHKDSFINKILFYLLVKMMGTLKSVAEQQMIGKPTLKLLAIFI